MFTELAGGPSLVVTDMNFKRRRDCPVRDRTLARQIQARIVRRTVPEIRKVHHFEATQLDRLILAACDAADPRLLRGPRDNTVRATEHRRFAVSIDLNRELDGDELVFPDYSRHPHRPDAGGGPACRSCSTRRRRRRNGPMRPRPEGPAHRPERARRRFGPRRP